MIIRGNLKTPLLSMERSRKEKLNTDSVDLTEVMNQMDLRNTYRIFHPKTKETSQNIMLILQNWPYTTWSQNRPQEILED